MMRTRLPRPRTIKSASPVRSWRTWVLVDASPRPHGDRLAAGQLLVVDLPGPLGHPFGPGQVGQLRRPNSRMQLAAANSRARSSSLPSATPDWPARTTPVPAVRVAGQHTAQGGHGAQEAASGPGGADQQHGQGPGDAARRS
jgi:hypothetical protein